MAISAMADQGVARSVVGARASELAEANRTLAAAVGVCVRNFAYWRGIPLAERQRSEYRI